MPTVDELVPIIHRQAEYVQHLEAQVQFCKVSLKSSSYTTGEPCSPVHYSNIKCTTTNNYGDSLSCATMLGWRKSAFVKAYTSDVTNDVTGGAVGDEAASEGRCAGK